MAIDMTTAVQQATRAALSGATENQRAALRGMWGRGKPDSGILIQGGEDVLPDPEHLEHQECPNCGKQDATIMYWPDRDILLAPWFRCCGAKA